LPASFYEQFNLAGVKLLFNCTYDILANAEMAMVTSGTATLETALLNVPQVVCYKGGTVSYSIAKMVVGGRVKYIGLPNLILDKPVVKELIQTDLNTKNLKEELTKIISGPVREEMLKEYDGLIKLLGNSGASKKVAELMYNHIHAKK
jgi:lipid-A-disaccharide synthase